MSYITFDYKCTECSNVESRMVKRSEMDEQTCGCCPPPLCPPMIKLPAGTRTTFREADTKLKF